MASPSVQVADGATITFGTSGFSAQVTGFSWGGVTREAIDTTHLGTAAPTAGNIGNKTSIPSTMVDPGELSLDIHINPDAFPPLHGDPETITVTWNSGATWVCSGYATGFDIDAQLENKVTGTLTIKMTGEVTPTAAA